MTYTETDLVASMERLAGYDLAALTQEQRDGFDQFHSGGSEAVDRLLPSLHLATGMTVLDGGSGLGGPARQVARSTGCTVVGVDITPAYVDAARALTRTAGLAEQVSFFCSDIATFDQTGFDAAYTMHVQMNVADKGTYFTEIAHRLRPGAHFATFEVCRSGDIEPTPPLPWSLDGTDSFLATADELRDTIQSSGFELVEWVDETAWVRQWFEDLGGRIAAGGTQATLSALLTDGVTRMLNLAVAVTTGVVTVHRASFILAPAVRSIGLGMASRSRHRIADVHNVVVAHMPDYRVDSVVQVGEGLGNIAYEVNGELIVRFSKEPDAARRTALLIDEARLIAAVAEVSPLPVPEPTFTAAEQGYLAYFKLPGVPLLDMSRHERSDHGTSIAATLGELLTAMHAVPVDRWADLVDTDDHPLAEWRREAAESYMTVVGQVPAVYRRPVETFLDATPPHDGYTTAFSHNDLGIEHVLIDPVAWTVTGIIDWSDAAIVDPAYDFGLLYRDLGPAAFRAALRRYRNDASDAAALTERAVFYARCSVFEDLAYGVETGRDKYVDKSLAAMEWLFPA